MFNTLAQSKLNSSSAQWHPQGIVLGPVLFVIYINDLAEVIDSSTYAFANDTEDTTKMRSVQ